MSPSIPFWLGLPPCILTLILVRALSIEASIHAPAQSATVSTDLICHTTDPNDCNPAIFSPTKQFQIIHDDQSIPPGLHVRMNLATGLKEARLNVPEKADNDDDAAAVVVIDHGSGRENWEQQLLGSLNEEKFVVQAQQPSYNPFERVGGRPPTSPSARDDIVAATSRILSASLREDSQAILEDLDFLSDVAHDAEWGAQIVQDQRTSAALLEFMDPREAIHNAKISHATALLLGNALQNNDDALRAFFAYPRVSSHIMTVVLKAMKYSLGSVTDRPDVVYANRLTFLLSQLCRDSSQLEKFVSGDGPFAISEMLKIEADGTEAEIKKKLRTRIANFVADFAPTIAQHKASHAVLIELCDTFQNDPQARHNTQSVEYTSTLAARQALENLPWDLCIR